MNSTLFPLPMSHPICDTEIIAIIGSFLQVTPLLKEQVLVNNRVEFSVSYIQKLSQKLFTLPLEQKEEIATCITQFFGANASEQAHITLHLVNQPDVLFWASHLLDFWNTSAQCFYFATSGSTHIPTTHAHTLSILFQEATLLAQQLPTTKRIISVMPIHHVYGFTFSVIIPLALGIPSYTFSPIPTEDFFAFLRPFDAVVAFPLLWEGIISLTALQQPQTMLPQPLTAITATSPCPRHIIKQLNSAGGLTTFEVYGSTETSVIGTRTGEQNHYRLLPWWQAHDRPSQNTLLVRNSQPHEPLHVLAPDILQFSSGNTFAPIARHDKAVQVGGENVYPMQIEEVLKTHPCIHHCAVRLMTPNEGHRLKAFIVPINNSPECLGALTGTVLQQWFAAHLSPASRPKHVTLGASVPTNKVGKRCDWDIQK